MELSGTHTKDEKINDQVIMYNKFQTEKQVRFRLVAL